MVPVRAVAVLFLVMLALIAAGYLFLAHEVTSVTAADRKATVAAREAAVAARKAARSSASQMALCQASNTARMEQVGLWEYVIRQSPRPRDAAGRARVARFERHLLVIFAPRDCAHLTPPPARPGPAASRTP